MNKKFRENIVGFTGWILHVFAVGLFVRWHYGASSSLLSWFFFYYLLSFFIGGPMPFIILAALIASILGFYSFDDFFSVSSSPSSSKSSYKRHYLRPGEDIRFYVENYTVSYRGERGDYWTVISGELCYQCGGLTEVIGQGRGPTEQVAYMAAIDDYKQNLKQAERDARRTIPNIF